MEKINFKDLPNTSTPINATNLNAIQTNTENAINGVVESGSNTNGKYIKFNDGTMICFNTKKYQFNKANFSSSGTNAYKVNQWIEFPVNFIEEPTVIISNRGITDGWGWIGEFNCNNEIITSVTFFSTKTSSTMDAKISWIAIGRWK